MSRGPCAKQIVRATIVAVDGSRFVGENDCANPQPVCPRKDLPTGVGYELCHDVCGQSSHAEIAALKAAGAAARGGAIYLEGHSYACENCRAACLAAGIARIYVAAPPSGDE
ncbi:hypothetical protein [Methylocella tundrae]|uniref:hypothetical protein n=1 Tax=Methylocella tundrae TaxID=227605 RepID=UPI0030FE8C4B|nr:hypothetical protein SIN04_06615 [Methylocella tundrae]